MIIAVIINIQLITHTYRNTQIAIEKKSKVLIETAIECY